LAKIAVAGVSQYYLVELLRALLAGTALSSVGDLKMEQVDEVDRAREILRASGT
jgi:hypothetical protein